MQSTLPDDIWSSVRNVFAREHPRIVIAPERSGSIVDLFKRYADERDHGTSADLLIANDVENWPVLAGRREFLSLTLPHGSGSILDSDGELHIVAREPQVWLVNVKQLEKPPVSLEELAAAVRRDPSLFRGRIGAYDPEKSPFAYAVFWMLMSQNPQRFWRSMEAIGPMLRLEETAGALVNGVSQGRLVLSLYVPKPFIPPDRELLEAHLEWLYPRDGVPRFPRELAVPRTAAHPDAGQVLADFLLSPAGQAVVAKSTDVPAGLRTIEIKSDPRLPEGRQDFMAHFRRCLTEKTFSGQRQP